MKSNEMKLSHLVLIVQLCLLVIIPCGSVKPLFSTVNVKAATPQPGVQMHIVGRNVVLDNGLVQVSFSNPEGSVTDIKYKGVSLLDQTNKGDDRGYWDIVWDKPDGPRGPSKTDKISSTKFQVIKKVPNHIELSFSSTWSGSAGNPGIPLNVDKRFIMLAGQAGIYSYGIFDRPVKSPDLDVDQIRIVFKLAKDKFTYMAISDQRQRLMPTEADRNSGQTLAYPEAVRLTSRNPAIRGQVDDKYQYSCENKDNRVHGWISFNPSIGLWVITPSTEFRAGGPSSQDLTSHVGPTALSMFASLHYSGEDARMRFRNGEPWRKVFGPIFTYVNSAPQNGNPLPLWKDAKSQMIKETNSWPYNFPVSIDLPAANLRGSIRGQLLVCDRYSKAAGCPPAAFAHVGLAPQGPPGSWQTEAKGYQFWTKTDKLGNFLIKGVRGGNYGLYAWVPGVMGDYKYEATINLTPGLEKSVGVLKYVPPRYGPTLWEIGIPDRSAAEFFIPDARPEFLNKLYIKHDRFRQYGLWQRYAALYPQQDLTYMVGKSDFRRDWFYAHVTRNLGNRHQGTTWQIQYDLQNVLPSQNYVLQIALASATESELQVRVNDGLARVPVFTTGLIGRDNAIARHGIHGLYSQYSVNIPGAQLHVGRNTIFLTQARSTSAFAGIMYDYLRLEGPPPNP